MIQEASNSFKEHEASVSFKVSPAECIPVEDNSTQLVLVGRALHYFDQKTFFKEVDRMLVNICSNKFESINMGYILKGREWSSCILQCTFSNSDNSR